MLGYKMKILIFIISLLCFLNGCNSTSAQIYPTHYSHSIQEGNICWACVHKVTDPEIQSNWNAGVKQAINDLDNNKLGYRMLYSGETRSFIRQCSAMLKTDYGIELIPEGTDMVDKFSPPFSCGYNTIMIPNIISRYGKNVVDIERNKHYKRDTSP